MRLVLPLLLLLWGTGPLVELPQAARERCAQLAPSRDIPVLCPQRLTPGRWTVRHRTLRPGRREYLCNLETRPFGSGAAFHVLAGGRAGRFPLGTTASGGWPRDTRLARDLGLVGARPLRPGEAVEQRVRLRLVRRTTVAGHRALLLRVAGYPDGGVHGGHLAVVWNQGAAGYVLSMHFSGPARERALLQAAVEMSGVSPRRQWPASAGDLVSVSLGSLPRAAQPPR